MASSRGLGTPVTQFVDVGPMLQEMDLLARKAGKRRMQFFTKLTTAP
jgi:hypothetical protein